MNKYNSTIYGCIPCPANFDELLNLISQNKKNDNGQNVSYWRGQPNIDWKIDSGAVRRLRRKENTYPNPDSIAENDICYYEKSLIAHARKNMFDFDFNHRRITDFELLAKLQHNGAATRLVDFSKNALIGLFFCTNDQQYKDNFGLLLGVDTDIVAGHEDRFNYDFSYDDFIARANKKSYLINIAPPCVSERIAAQHALFLCSEYVDGNYGSIYLGEDDKYYKYIAISPELKMQCTALLTNCFDITRKTMFPDFTGFCEINSVSWGTGAHTRW